MANAKSDDHVNGETIIIWETRNAAQAGLTMILFIAAILICDGRCSEV